MTPRRRRRCARVIATSLVLGALAAGAGAAPATAATVEIDQSVLRVVDSAGELNALQVSATALGYDVFDDAAALTAGAGCAPVRVHQVTCPTVMVAKIFVDAGARGDYVLLAGVAVPVEAHGGPGDDLLQGGGRVDVLEGGEGDDAVIGGADNDTLAGDDGIDLLQGGTGGDSLRGGIGDDILEGQAGSGDLLEGGDGRDLLNGGEGDDLLRGGPGSDALVTAKGKDIAVTGTGDADRVFAMPGDKVVCNPGDEVRRGSEPPPPGCTSLAADVRVPTAWPPPTPAAAPTPAGSGPRAVASYAGPRAAGEYTGRLGKGRPRQIVVTIRGNPKEKVPVKVKVVTFGKPKKRLKPFTTHLRTGFPQPISIRGPISAVVSAKVICCGG